MEIHSLEDIRREDDGRLVWRFMVTGDISGAPHNPHMIGANRIWEVTTDATAPVVIDDAYAPRAPDVVPDHTLAQELARYIRDELVRARVAHLTAPEPEPAPPTPRGRRRTRLEESA